MAIEKKRKNIDLSVETLKKLSIKAFIENILETKANSLSVEVSTNPSPSGDPWFDDPENMAEVEKRVKAHKEGKVKSTVVLQSTEDITNFINSL